MAMTDEERKQKARERWKLYVAAHPERVRASHDRWNVTHPERYKGYPKDKSKHNRTWRTQNPEKFAAHSAVSKAVEKGQLVKPRKCTLCHKRGRLEAHHPDYSKVLEVVWLCHGCHRIVDGRIRKVSK